MPDIYCINSSVGCFNMNKYIKKAKSYLEKIVPKREEGETKKEYRINLLIKGAEAFVFVIAALAIFKGAATVLPGAVTVSNSVNGRELPIYCVETDEKKIALTFDNAWGNEDIGRILDILKRHNIHATFFMTGGWVEAYPDDVKAILAAGHDLGNHSENHKNMSQLSDSECQEELMKVHTKVQELTGYEMNLFRAPYGDYDNHVITNAVKSGYFTIQWDVDSLDWKDYGVDSIMKEVTENKHLGNGSIILCHGGAKYTADVLDRMITKLQKEGYEFVPVSQLIYREHYHMNAEGRQMKD